MERLKTRGKKEIFTLWWGDWVEENREKSSNFLKYLKKSEDFLEKNLKKSNKIENVIIPSLQSRHNHLQKVHKENFTSCKWIRMDFNIHNLFSKLSNTLKNLQICPLNNFLLPHFVYLFSNNNSTTANFLISTAICSLLSCLSASLRWHFQSLNCLSWSSFAY